MTPQPTADTDDDAGPVRELETVRDTIRNVISGLDGSHPEASSHLGFAIEHIDGTVEDLADMEDGREEDDDE